MRKSSIHFTSRLNAAHRRIHRASARGPQEEMRREAAASVAARRGPELAALRTEAARPGVFAWAGGPPAAGESAVLAYKAAGPLRCPPRKGLLNPRLGYYIASI